MRYLLILLSLLLCGCAATHPPTQAGNTARKGLNNVPVAGRENRHF
jgi:hypothetical protein